MALVGGGVVAGYFIDRWLGTSPLFMLLLLFAGLFAGIRNFLRIAAKNDAKDNENHKDGGTRRS